MAQSYQTPDATLFKPGGYPQFTVASGAAGTAQTGILLIVGEADAGPDYTLETDLSLNQFGPSQLADVAAKYGSGPLVDAVRQAAQASADENLPGAPAGFLLVKTNPSQKASSVLQNLSAGTYGTLYDRSYGKLGNLIYYTLTQKTAEVKPTTGAFTYIPPVGTLQIGLRVNGAAEVQRTGVAAESPAAFQAAVTALTGISCTGGVNRAVLNAAHGSITVANVGGNAATFTLTGIANWDVTPTVGDTLVIPAGSAVAGGSNQNVGAYVVTAATSTVITATKLSDAAKPAAVIGTITAPAAAGPSAVVGANTDLVCYSPITITQSSSTVLDGVGKTLEINEETGGTDLLSRYCFVLGTTTPVTWVSKSGAPQQLTSAAQYQVSLNVNRQVDNVADTESAGGNVALQIGYTGTTCTVAVTATTMTLTMTGGAGAGISPVTITLANYPTLNDLAQFINSLAGFKCAVGSSAVGQLSSLMLDEVVGATASTTWGNYTLQLKYDAVDFYNAVARTPLLQFGNPAKPAALGLPQVVTATTYLSGGTRGATTDAVFNAGVDALETVQGNFVVPCFAQDATADITNGLTDSGSTYTIANIHAYVKTHCLKMSQRKRRKHRQGALGYRGTYVAAKQAAQTLATSKCALAFQDIKVVGANGIVQAQPWMTAITLAACQAAGGYKPVFAKLLNCNGFVQAAGDFNSANQDQVEDALQAGLIVGEKAEDGGGFQFVSDQTTYSKDNNFVYNSFQAVYGAHTIARTLGQRMQRAMVGQSVADVGAPAGIAALEAIMGDLLRLKFIAKSDDAPKGYKNVVVSISGPVATVKLDVKLAGAIYFVTIDFNISQVQQTASV